jgi:hypothetical protein
VRTLLICHDDSPLDREGLARWLSSFSDYAGTVVIEEPRQRMRKRVGREIRRVGALRFLDVLAFRLYYRLRVRASDRQWEALTLERLRERYPVMPEGPVLLTPTPNSAQTEQFLRLHRPDVVLARCKTILQERIFSIPTTGTFVLHPGICPEYRNAHGCFWALANGERDNVGMTLLRIDRGVDTGPIFGYYRCDFDESRESHIRIQHRVVLENLEEIAGRLTEIHQGRGSRIDVTGRRSGAWGQPWLSRHWRIRARARARVRYASASTAGDRQPALPAPPSNG